MNLPQRMKRYEIVSQNHLGVNQPVIIRIDGKAFHTFTKGLPIFDYDLRKTFITAAYKTMTQLQNCTIAYHQSDEVSFLLSDTAKPETNAWFDNNVQKTTSVTASIFTGWFYYYYWRLAFFDARVFTIPDFDVSNYFLWRMLDAERNSISMLAQAHFSPKQLHNKSNAERLVMLHEKGIQWHDLKDFQKWGTFITKNGVFSVEPTYDLLKRKIKIERFYDESRSQTTLD